MKGSSYIFLGLLGFCYAANVKRELHWFMTENELHHYFGVSSPSQVTSYEVVHVKKTKVANFSKRADGSHIPNVKYEIKSQERSYSLHLSTNNYLLSPHAKIVRTNGNETHEIPLPEQSCHLLHRGEDVVAAVSHCGEELKGYIIDAGRPLEIHSLNPRLKTVAHNNELFTHEQEDSESVYLGPHILKPIHNLPSFSYDEDAPVVKIEEADQQEGTNNNEVEKRGHHSMFHKRRVGSGGPAALTLELAVFVDPPAYKKFSGYLKDDAKVRDLILAYVNGMQAIYYQPSLGRSVNLVIARLELMATQPADFNAANGERGALLDNFCAWNAAKNNPDDASPDHWDMGLFVSALDFYAMEAGKPNYITMGLAGVGGICTKQYACVIGELGTVASTGKPYPSTGFTAIYVMAHEIGHNLGMFHDSSQNTCPTDGFIMSPSRGVRGEATWSTCSADVMAKFTGTCLDDSPFPPAANNDHAAKYRNMPGKDPFWSLDRQCQIFLQDPTAIFGDANRDTICYSIKCRSPSKDGYYLAGPALEGTPCTTGFCIAGECKAVARSGPIVEGGWSEWSSGSCKSSCIEGSKGTVLSTRTCDNPVPVGTDEGCDGPATKVEMCDDEQECPVRMSAGHYATEKCQEFAEFSTLIRAGAPGSQQPHLPERPWQACSIFCTRQDNDLWYTPRLELNDKGVSPAFPDGTWCHNDGTEDYYCIQRQCVSKSTSLARTSESLHNDLDVLNNALNEEGTHFLKSNPHLVDFATVDRSGMPISVFDIGHKHVEADPSHDSNGLDYVIIENNDL